MRNARKRGAVLSQREAHNLVLNFSKGDRHMATNRTHNKVKLPRSKVPKPTIPFKVRRDVPFRKQKHRKQELEP